MGGERGQARRPGHVAPPRPTAVPDPPPTSDGLTDGLDGLAELQALAADPGRSTLLRTTVAAYVDLVPVARNRRVAETDDEQAAFLSGLLVGFTTVLEVIGAADDGESLDPVAATERADAIIRQLVDEERVRRTGAPVASDVPVD